MPTALITGAGIRIGSAIARALAACGHDLVLHAHRSTASLDELAGSLRASGRTVTTHSADLSDPASVDGFAKTVRAAHASLDVLVNNAGIFEKTAFESITREQYRRMLAINLDAPFFLTQQLLPALRNARSPVVINLCDIGGERPVSRYAHYSVSKAAMIMFTRALAVELAPHIRVNGISPGTVAFPPDFDEKMRESVLKRVPLGREGSVDDVAKAVVYLVRDAPYVTGQILSVDGGRSTAL